MVATMENITAVKSWRWDLFETCTVSTINTRSNNRIKHTWVRNLIWGAALLGEKKQREKGSLSRGRTG
ncbi:hypothetical protein L1987_40470 [Smallanthus sonchifolius]|uniref:Uncharacterized protein n=1 Tax=Smallanthus sonchifolius TaxID=185202 RepID=A0ACB9GSN5_9ASTR|nr:hypothetical protein L1987_40470 [Smallanthus sonchifolius]